MLDERSRTLLKALVEHYIADGQPVGSRALSKFSGLDLSPATIRNVMSDLEELGLIASPHTSAGRIPTARGYRLFVDSLLTVQPLVVSAPMWIYKTLIFIWALWIAFALVRWLRFAWQGWSAGGFWRAGSDTAAAQPREPAAPPS